MKSDEFPILLLEDDLNDVELLTLAFHRRGIKNPIFRVSNGYEGIDYLQGEGIYMDRARYPLPKIIILDLKMPRMGGLEFLDWIDQNPAFHVVPTIVLSASNLAQDVQKSYDLKAHTYFVKPTEFPDLEELVKTMHEYWERALTPAKMKQGQEGTQ
ncbi:MAG: response regulator [Limisphaerales bacterium]